MQVVARTLPRGAYTQLRRASTQTPQQGWLYVDSVFPVCLAPWDFRYVFGLIRQEHVIESLRSKLSTVDLANFEVLSVEPHVKDGGVFVRFKYPQLDGQPESADLIQEKLREHVEKHGGIPSWAGMSKGNIWVVKGEPWREDMYRFAINMLKVNFDGPDVREERLYQLLRPYGQIAEIISPTPVPAGTLRSSTVVFRNIRSANIARNVLHGYQFVSETGSTRLATTYERVIQAHVIREWMAKHPKIVLPFVLFLLGTLTYTIFDPIRTLTVEGKVLNWFDYREYKAFKWLRENTLDRMSTTSSSGPTSAGVWKERTDAQDAVSTYLSDLPTTISFIHGPQGSGKTKMVSEVIKSSGRRTLFIDCAAIYKHHDSDSGMVSALAHQTGYWPIFTFLNSVNNMIDLASVGLIGQKTGLSSSLTEQLRQVLDIVGKSLRRVNSSYTNSVQKKHKEEERRKQAEELMRKIHRGEFHDGRIDCVAGNGVMSELGVGDEPFGENDWDVEVVEVLSEEDYAAGGKKKHRTDEELERINALPVVIIRNYEDKTGNKEDVLDVLAQWAATMVENQVAHVIVMSDNRENSKRLAKALPTKPLNFVALSDADSRTALSFVQQKLKDADADVTFTSETSAYIERLGGRASDLESLIYKVRSGASVEDAVEDIITRGVGELRKNAFGDDADDAKNLPWSREQAWGLMKRFINKSEISYHEVLMDFPFKGDEMALRNMEHAELITITTHNGRPSKIKPGKPVYKYVFERVVGDPVFSATQDIEFNKKLIATQETTITSCEDELAKLMDIGERTASAVWGKDRAISARIRYLLKKMGEAESKIEGLEKVNARLKKVISK